MLHSTNSNCNQATKLTTAIMYCLMVVAKLPVMLVDIFNVVVEDSLLRPTAHYTTSHLENTKKRKICCHDVTTKYMLEVNLYTECKVSDKIL